MPQVKSNKNAPEIEGDGGEEERSHFCGRINAPSLSSPPSSPFLCVLLFQVPFSSVAAAMINHRATRNQHPKNASDTKSGSGDDIGYDGEGRETKKLLTTKKRGIIRRDCYALPKVRRSDRRHLLLLFCLEIIAWLQSVILFPSSLPLTMVRRASPNDIFCAEIVP